MNFNEQNKEIEFKACIDLKQGKGDFAGQAWNSMLECVKMEHHKQPQDMDVSVVKSLQNLLLCSVRCHRDELFQTWLQPTWDAVCQLPFPKELGQFLLNVAFVVGDRHMEFCLPNLQTMLKQYRRICQKNNYSLDEFLTEWLNFSAQMLVRNADNVSITFIKCYLRMLYFCTDWDVLRKQLWKYYFYMQGFAQEYGLEKSLKAYGLIDYLVVILYERTLKIDDRQKQRITRSGLLGCISNWLLGMATVTEMEEADVTDIWKQQAFADGQSKLKTRFEHFCDRVNAYRLLMRPRKIHK